MNEHSLRILEFSKARDIVASFSQTDFGRVYCRSLLPFQNRKDAEKIFDATEDLGVFLAEHHLPGYNLHDLEPRLVNAAIVDFVLTKADLWSTAETLTNISGFRDLFREATPPHHALSGLARDIRPLKELLAAFKKTFDDAGEIRDDATDELLRIRNAIRETRRRIQKLLNGLFESRTFVSSLDDR